MFAALFLNLYLCYHGLALSDWSKYCPHVCVSLLGDNAGALQMLRELRLFTRD